MPVSTIVFYLLAIAGLLLMAYWMWGGVGRRRPELGRGFGAIAMALAAYVAWLLWGVVT